MELLDVVDENNVVIGQATREECHKKKLLHRSVGVFVFRTAEKKEMFIQQRSPTIRTPNKWETPVGHVPSSMSMKDAVLMEISEELFHNTETPKLELKELFTVFKTSDNDPEFRTQFLTVYDGPTYSQPSEVADSKWISVEELLEEMKINPKKFTEAFVDTLEMYFGG